MLPERRQCRRSLLVFENSDEGRADGEARAVERMDEFVLSLCFTA